MSCARFTADIVKLQGFVPGNVQVLAELGVVPFLRLPSLDTSVLARYYVADAADTHAQRQRVAARRLIESGQPLMVSRTVILELEWVMRGYYGFSQPEVASVLRHLLGLHHVTVEDRGVVEQALSNFDVGLDFVDALHHASYKACESVATFDDRKFARRARKSGMTPAVMILA